MLKVLIVEDDPMVRMLTVKFLRSIEGFKVAKDCGNAADALSYLESHDVDLIVLDMFLPDMKGINLLKEIRKRELWVSVIFVTASNTSEDIQRSFNLGAIDYLVKPFSFDRLRDTILKYRSTIEGFRSKAELTQGEIDRYRGRDEVGKLEVERPKGIQNSTLEKILGLLKDNSDREWSSKEVSKELDISVVTIKKYLDYLEKLGRITSHLSYQSVGRPQILYKFLI